jgi:hypothetical protein
MVFFGVCNLNYGEGWVGGVAKPWQYLIGFFNGV